MSIDAVVSLVMVSKDRNGTLDFIDSPSRRLGSSGGIAGQDFFYFSKCPPNVAVLAGLEIWGGDSSILLGEVKIADREGYNRIVFCEDEKFDFAIKEYFRKQAGKLAEVENG